MAPCRRATPARAAAPVAGHVRVALALLLAGLLAAPCDAYAVYFRNACSATISAAIQCARARARARAGGTRGEPARGRVRQGRRARCIRLRARARPGERAP